MNFSDCIEHTDGVLEYSPNGRLVALAKAFDVLVSIACTLYGNTVVKLDLRDRITEADSALRDAGCDIVSQLGRGQQLDSHWCPEARHCVRKKRLRPCMELQSR